MNYTRWYDQDVNLKMIMETVEKMSDEKQLSIAQDIVQMITEECPQTDTLIDELNGQYLPTRRRWYDKYETLHTAVELIRLMEAEERKDLLKEIFYSIIYETYEPATGYQ